MTEERRQFIRAFSQLIAFYKEMRTENVHRALTKNVSGGGLCLVTETSLEPGTMLEVELRLPDHTVLISFAGEVIWSRPTGSTAGFYKKPTYECGVKTVTIDPKDQSLLTQFAEFTTRSPDLQK